MNAFTSTKLFRSMLRIRRVEEALAARYAEQEMRCPMHLCIGQEAIAVGVCENLEKTDLIFSNHRAHGHYLAKGGDLQAMVAELYGRSTGCCGGRGGSMHLIDLNVGFMGATPIVGGTVPLAVGAAWSASLRGRKQVTVVFFGDGCFEEGVLHEAMNFAALHKLPVVFVCENNDFSVYTRRNDRQPNRSIYKVAASHGIEAVSGNGNDVEEVMNIASQAIDNARNGNGPQFLEFETYRWLEHCGPNFDDELNYRSVVEMELGLSNCPIKGYKLKMAEKIPEVDVLVQNFESEIRKEIEEAFIFASSSKQPSLQDAMSKLYA